jgi:hypothetical protein
VPARRTLSCLTPDVWCLLSWGRPLIGIFFLERVPSRCRSSSPDPVTSRTGVGGSGLPPRAAVSEPPALAHSANATRPTLAPRPRTAGRHSDPRTLRARSSGQRFVDGYDVVSVTERSTRCGNDRVSVPRSSHGSLNKRRTWLPASLPHHHERQHQRDRVLPATRHEAQRCSEARSAREGRRAQQAPVRIPIDQCDAPD